MDWYQLTIDQALHELKTTTKGLSQTESTNRLKQFGPNKLNEKRKRSSLKIFLSQFQDLLVIILLFAAVISGFIGDVVDTIVIIIIALLNAFIGFYQEIRTERAIHALKKNVRTLTKIHRDAEVLLIEEELVVPGDVVSLEAGNLVPADLRVISSSQLKIDESALTGESLPVAKTSATIDQPNLPIADQQNMSFKGTFVCSCSCCRYWYGQGNWWHHQNGAS